MRQGATGLFVKQMRDHADRRHAHPEARGACYEVAATFPKSRRIMPRLIRYDEARHTLVLELLPEAESLLAYHRHHKAFRSRSAQVWARRSALYHGRQARCREPRLKASAAPDTGDPTLGRGGHDILGRSAYRADSFGAAPQHKDFEGLLDALGAEWRFDSLIHGDMKWDNVLVFPGRRRARLPHC